MRLVQVRLANGERAVSVTNDDGITRELRHVRTVHELANKAIKAGLELKTMIDRLGFHGTVDLEEYAANGRILSPIDHPDPAHLLVTGTGLTHLGSAAGRDAMHRKTLDAEKLTDSMKMFRLGIDGGKPQPGEAGVQPEWFFKGDGSIIAAPGEPLVSPGFALDGGEEPEIVGVYVIGADGTPWRLGFALGNEFSDHVMERQNYLYLAHSKLRPCSFGPELLIGQLPEDIHGQIRLRRGDSVIWEREFLTGETNMSHSIRNLEFHHFKYPMFRRPGDIHIHYFGTATLSFSDGISAKSGDGFEISAAPFGLPLVNRLCIGKQSSANVHSL